MLRCFVFAATQSPPADPTQPPIPFPFTLLRIPLSSPESQPFYFQSTPDFLHETPGVGVPLRLCSPLFTGHGRQNTVHGPTIFVPIFRLLRSAIFYFRFSIFRFPYPLPSSVSRNSFVCHSYEKLPGCTPFFPKRNMPALAGTERSEPSRNGTSRLPLSQAQRGIYGHSSHPSPFTSHLRLMDAFACRRRRADSASARAANWRRRVQDCSAGVRLWKPRKVFAF